MADLEISRLKLEATAYSTPLLHAAYSECFFLGLTFSQTLNLDLPTIADEGSVSGWTFDSSIPSTAAATIILPNDVIPHVRDIQPIIRAMDEAYINGKRSVCLTMKVSGRTTSALYHFSKVRQQSCGSLLCLSSSQIRLFVSINNNTDSVVAAKRLVKALMPSSLLSHVLNEKIRKPICGFSASCSLWNLVCLLDEEWLYDDVLNCLSELLYFRHAVTASGPPLFLFLPTRFIENARLLFSILADYSCELLAFRRRVEECPFVSFGFIAENAGHYSSYFCDGSSQILEHADSLHHRPAPDILDTINWVLAGVSAPKKLYTEFIARQPGAGIGSGSCGVASYNYIE